MRIWYLAIPLLAAGAASAQPRRFDPLPLLRQYLQLSETQAQSILSNNDEYNRWSVEKQQRIRQVQIEIAEETRREPLDPGALGIRYAEIEAICRQMRDRAQEHRARNLAGLSQEQRARVTALDEALKLFPVITEAQYSNVMGDAASTPGFFNSSSASVGGSVIGGFIGGATGCVQPFLTVGSRTGDFTFSAGQSGAAPR